MMNKSLGRHRLWLYRHQAKRSGLLRVLADEQRLRPATPSAAGWGTASESARAWRITCRASLDANVAEGPLAIRAGVSPDNVERAIASIDEEIQRLVDDGLSASELDESRQFLIGSMPRALETNGGIANFLQSEEFFRPRPRLRRPLPSKLRAPPSPLMPRTPPPAGCST